MLFASVGFISNTMEPQLWSRENVWVERFWISNDNLVTIYQLINILSDHNETLVNNTIDCANLKSTVDKNDILTVPIFRQLLS